MIPSVARIVHIGDTSNHAEAIQPMPDDAAAPVGGSASPDVDTSTGAEIQQKAGTATHDAAASGTATVAPAIRGFSTRPAGSSRPVPSVPVLPATSLVAFGASGLYGRRWLRRSRS